VDFPSFFKPYQLYRPASAPSPARLCAARRLKRLPAAYPRD
jgi:hypothetical protein